MTSRAASACWPVSMLNANERNKNMDTEDFTKLAETILEEHDREMFDEELEVLS